MGCDGCVTASNRDLTGSCCDTMALGKMSDGKLPWLQTLWEGKGSWGTAGVQQGCWGCQSLGIVCGLVALTWPQPLPVVAAPTLPGSRRVCVARAGRERSLNSAAPLLQQRWSRLGDIAPPATLCQQVCHLNIWTGVNGGDFLT